MGTRSITHIKDGNTTIVTLYGQFDGYPEGWGKDLATFLVSFRLVNGFGTDTTNVANDMYCLAGQIIAKFKTECGNFYVYPADTNDMGEEFTYVVNCTKDNDITLEVIIPDESQRKLFSGNVKEYAAWLEKVNEEEEYV